MLVTDNNLYRVGPMRLNKFQSSLLIPWILTEVWNSGIFSWKRKKSVLKFDFNRPMF